MLNLNISIWHNDQNPESTSFSTLFQDDLTKCLDRFGLKSNIQLNPESAKDDLHIIILSSADDVSSIFAAQVKKFNQPDLVAVILDPIESANFNTEKYSLSINFWDKLYTTGEVRLFRRDIPETRHFYWEKITDIVVELKNRLTTVSKPKQGCIYLSQDDISHSADRENLMRDIYDLGFDVLPSKPLSSDFDECTNQIKDALEKSQLIIHIIPPIYTPFFINQHLSIAEHQCNVSAVHLNSNPNTNRVIWISSAYEITDEENQVSVEKIQRDQEQTKGSTVLKTSIEDLKKYYHQILITDKVTKTSTNENPDVYIIADSNSNGLINNIKETLESKNLNIETNFSGITFNQHITKLAVSRMVVLCYTTENEQWLTVKVNDILKSRGVDAYRPFEKLILVKGDSKINTNAHQAVFTHILNDINDLSLLSIDKQP
jgi:hypothetical protein